MNKHRSHYSKMGLEPSTEERPLSYKELGRRVQKLVDIWGMDAVVTAVRKMYEKEKKQNG